MRREPQAFFLTNSTSPLDQRFFCIHHPAQGGALRGQVIYVHPFAEEMNKARRMAALQCRALAAAGFSVLQIDLAGCGDSSGDFGDASWDGWIEDILLARQWLREQDIAPPPAPLWLWGLRAGCLLATEAGRRLDEPVNYCFWQPAANGKLLLQQFLRLKLAAEMMGGTSKGLMEDMKRQLAEGRAVEIAGYMLSPAVSKGLERAQLSPPTGQSGRLEWFELSTREDAALTPVAEQALSLWSDAGFRCRSQIVPGPAFWQTAEIEDAPALLDATLAALSAAEAARA